MEAFYQEKLHAAGRRMSDISTSGQTGSAGTIQDELELIHMTLTQNRLDNELGYGNRPHKANVFTRYSFADGKLKGLFVGGGVRF